MRQFTYPALLIYCIFICLMVVSCQQGNKKEGSGEELAKQYCASCHLLPQPGELNKKVWGETVLPRMGYLLGFKEWPREVLNAFDDYPEGKIAQRSSPYFIENEPPLSKEAFDKIVAYYLENAPEELDFENPFEDLPVNTFLKPREVSLGLDHPSTTMSSFLAPGKLMAADYLSGRLLQLDKDFNIKISEPLEKAVLQFQEDDDAFWATVFGDQMEGTDAPSGSLIRYPKNRQSPKTPITDLQRPSDVQITDLNGDNLKDFVICEFGKYTGALAWWKNTGTSYEKKVLLNLPGAINTQILDWDGDGDQDIVALFGQAKEAIYLFINEGNENFSTKTLMEFPATYGSTNLLVTDFNADGLHDMIYSHGDNGDYVPLHKPYHGIRIYLGQGNDTFEEAQFIPLPGIYKTIFLDLDADGDRDFLTISFFPSEDQPSFVFLENDGQNHFSPSRISNEFASRWMTMDAMDYDEDGDVDVVLGGFHWKEDNYASKLGLLYLENQLK
ncbi:FG-GAP repeat domain-containing protein [Marinoscillum furvescens]|nr:VCBS repeat-containing protein [Marinoscillum furvescens]